MYRSEIRGHYAPGGRTATTWLQEQNWFALPAVLDSLESYARWPIVRKTVTLNGCIRVLGTNGYIPQLRQGQEIC
jgi:hypothetical protein